MHHHVLLTFTRQAQGFLLSTIDDEINSVIRTLSNVESPFGVSRDCTDSPPGLPL